MSKMIIDLTAPRAALTVTRTPAAENVPPRPPSGSADRTTAPYSGSAGADTVGAAEQGETVETVEGLLRELRATDRHLERLRNDAAAMRAWRDHLKSRLRRARLLERLRGARR